MTLSETDPWAAAEDVASKQRSLRLHPPARERAVERWLRPVVIVLWLATTVVAIATVFTRSDLRDLLALITEGGVFVVLGLGMWWLLASRRISLRSSEGSIRSALPFGAWSAIRRQLANRDPIDPDHAEVVIELAHQQRRLTSGQLALFAWWVPMYLSIASESRNWIGSVLLVSGGAALLGCAVFLVVASRRLAHVIEHPDRTAGTA